MAKRLIIAQSNSFNPYYNLAYEEYLFNNLDKDTFVLYLWRNDNTVVIGINQNAYRECRVAQLKQNGGYIARRKTGGGAVYHDKNNLNFTFIADKDTYDVERQLGIILKGLATLGIVAVKSGRNDLVTEDNRKFSGNAFLEKSDKAMHHGTILINTDTDKIMKYLSVPEVKLKAKGVKSVVSRVVNLNTINDSITVDSVKSSFIEATKLEFLDVDEVIETNIDNADKEQLQKLVEEYSNERFILGNRFGFTASYDKRFEWGTASIEFTVNKGIIEDLAVFTDSLQIDISTRIEQSLKGKSLDSQIEYEDKAIEDVFNLIKYGG